MNPQDLGREFENSIHTFLLKTKLNVLREKDISSLYGKNITGIDHLIIR
jgi:hypothetical protein